MTIAGHDPSGGAGITADQRVVEASGCVSVTAITALTAQNTQGVSSIAVTDPNILRAQLRALFDDSPIAAVKIGMLGGSEQVLTVVDALGSYGVRNIVLDPVLASTGGVSLLDYAGKEALLGRLLPLCRVCTPNISEAAALTGREVHDIRSMEAAGRTLLGFGAKCVVVKGGHLDGNPTDVVVFNDDADALFLTGGRIATPHSHGTGCFLSSAIAARLALALSLPDAICAARSMLLEALANPVVVGRGRGYPSVVA